MKMNECKIILDLCGGTGAWSEPYKDAGYNVRIITLPDDDVRWFCHVDYPVYGILCAPICTHMSGSGAQYWPEKDKDGRTLENIAIVDACLRIVLIQNPAFWVLENPIGRLKRWLGDPVMYFNPCDYGGYMRPDEKTSDLTPLQDAYTKKTCLWGNFNKPIPKPIEPVYKIASNGDRYSPVNMGTGGKSDKTKEIRSITPTGFSRAFFEANQ